MRGLDLHRLLRAEVALSIECLLFYYVGKTEYFNPFRTFGGLGLKQWFFCLYISSASLAL